MKLSQNQSCPICRRGKIRLTGVKAETVASCSGCGNTWTLDSKEVE